MTEVHEALRRVSVASGRLLHWEMAYRCEPTDYNAELYTLSWQDMRAAVDALVALKLPGESVELAE